MADFQVAMIVVAEVSFDLVVECFIFDFFFLFELSFYCLHFLMFIWEVLFYSCLMFFG